MRSRTLLVLLLITLSSVAYSHSSSKLPFHFFTQKDTVDWGKIEKKVSTKERRIFASRIKGQFKFFFEQAGYGLGGYSIADFENKLHFIDLNGDGKLDIIYCGYSGGESYYTRMFLNVNGKYVKIFEEAQYLESLDFDKLGKLKSLVMLDFGCCAEYIEYETTYLINAGYKFVIQLRRAKASFTVPPQRMLAHPFKIIVVNDNSKLRSAPAIDDLSTVIYDAEGLGNVIAKYSRNSTGLVWAEESDSTGRTWWLVEMEPVKKLSYSLVYFGDKIPKSIVGWMSSRCLKKKLD